jgi:hypothetical protein
MPVCAFLPAITSSSYCPRSNGFVNALGACELRRFIVAKTTMVIT